MPPIACFQQCWTLSTTCFHLGKFIIQWLDESYKIQSFSFTLFPSRDMPSFSLVLSDCSLLPFNILHLLPLLLPLQTFLSPVFVKLLYFSTDFSSTNGFFLSLSCKFASFIPFYVLPLSITTVLRPLHNQYCYLFLITSFTTA